MPLVSIPRVGVSGLNPNANPIAGRDSPGLRWAQNCVMRRPSVLEKRPGFNLFHPQTEFEADSVFEFRGTLLAHGGTTLWRYDPSVGFFVVVADDITPEGDHLEGIEIDRTFFFTTDKGIYRLDTPSGVPRRAGMPAMLDFSTEFTGAGAGVQPPDTQIGYRLVLSRIDVNRRFIEGGPSMRVVSINSPDAAVAWTRSTTTGTFTLVGHTFAASDIIAILASSDETALPLGNYTVQTIGNPGADNFTLTVPNAGGASGTATVGKAYDVIIDAALPADVNEKDFVDVYRTEPSSADTTDPGDTERVVKRVQIDFTDVTLAYAAGVVTVTHTAHGLSSNDVVKIIQATDDAFEEGLHFITYDDPNTYHYSVTGAPPASGTAKARWMVLRVTDDVSGSIGPEDLYTNPEGEGIENANARPPAAHHIGYVGNSRMMAINCRKEHACEIQLIDVTGLSDGTSSITLTQGLTALEYLFNSAESVVTRSFKRYTSEPTTAENIRKTALSLCKILNRDPSGLWYGYYVSGLNDPPGIVQIEAREISSDGFSVTCNNGTTSGKFSPNIPTSGTTYASENSERSGALYTSKPQQPDAVPDKNVDQIGRGSTVLLRVMSLRETGFIISNEGIWRTSSDLDFEIQEFDGSVQARAERTWTILDNSIFGVSSRGVIRITESGTSLLSWPVDNFLDEILENPDFDTLAFAYGDEREGEYVLCTPADRDATVASYGWVYNTQTRQWAGPWTIEVAGGIFSRQLQAVFLASQPRLGILTERRAANDENWIDDEFACEATAISTVEVGGETRSLVTISYSGTIIPEIGWSFRKDPQTLPFSNIIAIEPSSPGEYILTLEDYFPSLVAGAGVLGRAIDSLVWFIEDAGGDASVMKHFIKAKIYFEDHAAWRHEVGFKTDLNGTESWSAETITSETRGGVSLEKRVPNTHTRARALHLGYRNRYAQQPFKIVQSAILLRATGSRTTVRQV